ncbi:MAG: 8-amino-7-oxononanoate synthase [Alphaproteobacteria bacterium ADurb.BinA280]|jgi:8-amino-7-oxononanoate synthase|nr:8-amino-7-oxononanoate synthase [Xanthomonadales bacterium]MCC6505569.1 8-amino-7-oxononanoate synthase [Aquimonas sp.]OPZ10597.1 MAG: 8-amino-7-oxononanoate synthase [Alphaproteobacteria bacterium ADurb.BinA280]
MSRPSLTDRLRSAATERASAHLTRRLRVVEAVQGTRVTTGGRELLNFCSNDYLGLAQSLEVTAALQESAAWLGVGSTASHLICGHHREHAQLEEELADWLGYSKALVFGSGYLANLGLLQALLGKDDLVVQDKLNHACLLDGARLAGCELKRYPHVDAESAERQLQSRPQAAAMLATDGVFSMDGDLAPLRELSAIAKAQGALLHVDDAHGVGVVGPGGRGSVAASGLTAREVPLLLVTFGKAIGTYGAAICGPTDVIDALVETARPFGLTTALPPALAAATRRSLSLIKNEPWRRFKLAALIARFRRGARQLGLPVLDSSTPIQPLLVHGNVEALRAAQALQARGLLISAIRPPTVPEGRARLRVTLSSAHSESEVDQLLDALGGVLKDHLTPPRLPKSLTR